METTYGKCECGAKVGYPHTPECPERTIRNQHLYFEFAQTASEHKMHTHKTGSRGDHTGPCPNDEPCPDHPRIMNMLGKEPPNPPVGIAAVPQDNWKHRSRGMVCGTCMWFVPKARGDEHMLTPDEIKSRILVPIKILGRCRRHAPTLNGWPAIYDLDWCGDHKLDETKI